MNKTVCLATKFALSLLWIALPGCEGSNKTSREIKQSDYQNFADFWFDKTVADAGEARLEVVKKEYNFGILPPDVTDRHIFQIKNVGDNPLHLRTGPKSCKCTNLEIRDKVIPPQQTGEIELTFKTIEFADRFEHSGSVYTNDPENRQVKFYIKGKVAREISAVPGTFHFERLMPDSGKQVREILVFSEEWESFELADFSSTFGEPAVFETFPMTERQRSQYSATSGINIRLTFQPPAQPGRFDGRAFFRIKAPDRTIDQEIPIYGKVVRRITVNAISSDVLIPSLGRIQLGRVSARNGRKEAFLITVNDRERKLAIKKVSNDPEFIQVELRTISEKQGLYRMNLIFPPKQENAAYNREDHFGKLKVEFDHPRVQPLELDLDFYIFSD